LLAGVVYDSGARGGAESRKGGRRVGSLYHPKVKRKSKDGSFTVYEEI